MKKAIILGLISFTVFWPAVFGQDTGDRCVHYGWVEDKDPKGTNVRDAPSVKGRIIGNIPRAKDDGEQGMVEIIGYSNGWLQIRSGESVEGSSFFRGTGWISAKKVTAAVETGTGKPAPLYALPKKSSKKVGTIPSEELITIVGFDCFGFKVSYKGRTGWLAADDYCGNPVTTCP